MIAGTVKEKWGRSLFYGLFLLFTAAAAYTEQYLLAGIPFALLFFYGSWQNVNAIFYLLLICLPFSFEYSSAQGWGMDLPDEVLMLLVSIIFFATWVYSPKLISREKWLHPLVILLAIIVGWTMIAVYFSSARALSTKFLLAKSWYVGAFVMAPLIIFNQQRTIRIAAIVLVGSMLLAVLIALYRHSQTGFRFATINEALSPLFRNHVNYSSLLVCLLPVLAAMYTLTKSKGSRRWLIFVLMVMLIALYFSYARGAWLALLTGLLAYVLIKKRLLLYSFISVVILAIGSVFWLKSGDRYLRYAHDFETTIFHKNFDQHIISTYKLKDVSTAERFYRWIAGVRMIKDKPLTGYGPNTFFYNYKEYTVPAYKTWVSNNPEHSTVHNYYLLTAIEQGIPGLILLLVLLGTMLYYAEYLYNRINDLFYKTVAATVGVIMTMILVLNFLSDLVETDKVGSLFFMCLAVLVVTDVNTRKPSNSSPDIERIS